MMIQYSEQQAIIQSNFVFFMLRLYQSVIGMLQSKTHSHGGIVLAANKVALGCIRLPVGMSSSLIKSEVVYGLGKQFPQTRILSYNRTGCTLENIQSPCLLEGLAIANVQRKITQQNESRHLSPVIVPQQLH